MKDNNQNNHTKEAFQYLSYQTIKQSDTDLSFFDFIQKLEKLQKTHTIKSSVCSVRNKRVKNYFILLQKKAV
ncbi:hypothetical protein VN1291_14270 [Helicobacter pylori]|uniref:hypothetical protein n=1 Tax=Helicobacter pylori TaxID=210 RepID=UPI000EB5D13D|nr:hypothetical protein [Helicobacter pylori]BDO44615.1 hypothetical protein VN1291_07160 [Helicobacter pylori]BDO46218.1 hypothetical protein CHC155_07110 [Helicobacter pylori]GHQ46768.1 hypothetical protein VN0361_15020 [Helicobacter pylori]GHR44850.1 hypothetical protein VN1261_15340 [Helicobacter pylori]GHS34558.1 hypothetical protein VN1291_14270 [Helicobacter pylori]